MYPLQKDFVPCPVFRHIDLLHCYAATATVTSMDSWSPMA